MVHVLKVYLYSSARGKYEIRRIAATSEAIYSYNMLCQKISALFPSLTGKTFELSWKDEEGDDILMSTDEELAQAIANLDDGLVRIYVHVADGIQDVSSGKQAIHPHIVCDACNGKVQGYRYKCLQCDDYDLCNLCHVQDKHPGHDMLKLASPADAAHTWIFPGWRRLWQSMFGDFPVLQEKFASGHSHCSSDAQGACHKAKGSPNFKGKCPWKSSRKHRAEYVKNIGQTVANLLNPFGFDITVDVLQSDSDQEASSSKSEGNQGFDIEKNIKKESEEQNQEKIPSAESISNVDELESSKVVEKVSSESTSQAEADSSKPSLGARPKTKSPPPSVECVSPREATPEGRPTGLFAAAVEEAVKTLADDWTMINSIASDSEKDKEACSKVTETVSSSPQNDVSPKTEKKSATPVYEEKNEVPLHHDPKINTALQNMLTMGFTNEGGWLLRLLETKSGNICEALDALYRR